MSTPKNVYFFNNGNTAVTDGENQIPELQDSWLLLFVSFLASKGINPEGIRYYLPAGEAKIFKTDDGYNWTFKV